MAAFARIVTVTQTAKVASMIVQKKTQEGTENSRLRATARAPMASTSVSIAGEGSESARTDGRCVARRVSVQKGLADIIGLTSGFFFYCSFYNSFRRERRKLRSLLPEHLVVWLVETARGCKVESAAALLPLKHPRQSDGTVAR